MKNIAIIPARGGSKRIPKKNIKSFLGKPIIVYSIEVAIQSGLFDEVMVSTDDEEIADISKKYGAKVPFFRSKEKADDYATTSDVLEEVLLKYREYNKYYDIFCCMYPTAPFITQHILIKSYELLIKSKFESVFPVVRFSSPIQRALKIDNNKVSMICPENYKKRSQDLLPAYHDSGQFYWMRTNAFFKYKTLWTENTGAIELMEKETQDIDTIKDWEIAELKYKILQQISNKKNKDCMYLL